MQAQGPTTLQFGETFATPYLVAARGTDRKLYKASNTNMAQQCLVAGIVTNTGVLNGLATLVVFGSVTNNAWNWTTGGTLYLDSTSGQMTQDASSVVPSTTKHFVVCGYAESPTTIFWQLQSLATPTSTGGAGAVASVNGMTGAVVVTKSHVGLGSADNTADSSKPISTAQQTALNLKADATAIKWTTITAATDQTVTNSATLTNDTAITVPVLANTKYRMRFVLFIDTTNATADYKYGFTGPASPTLVRCSRMDALAGAAPVARAIDVALPASQAMAGTGTNGGYVQMDMILHNGANAGNVVFQFAQNTITAAQSVIRRAGSYVEWAVV